MAHSMKTWFSFAMKILLPFLLLAGLFLATLLIAAERDHLPVVWLSAAGILVSITLGILQYNALRKHIGRIKKAISELGRGRFPSFRASGGNDGIGELEKEMEEHIGRLRSMTDFARSMASGDFTGRLKSLGKEDEMGDALLSLNDSMMEAMKESDDRRREEENRTWSAQGLARFSSLFREAEDNLHELSRQMIRELVSYTEADVGALFLSVDQDGGETGELTLYGSYAFDREKYIDRRFRFGEGLVGRAALEKDVILINDLPPDYIKIHSGLGEDVPSSLLMVPVMLDNNVLGVIELASLGEFPATQVDFIRQLSDALATTLAKVTANLQTRRLFEQTKQQAEALASQEAVFRQNMQRLEKEIESLKNNASK